MVSYNELHIAELRARGWGRPNDAYQIYGVEAAQSGTAKADDQPSAIGDTAREDVSQTARGKHPILVINLRLEQVVYCRRNIVLTTLPLLTLTALAQARLDGERRVNGTEIGKFIDHSRYPQAKGRRKENYHDDIYLIRTALKKAGADESSGYPKLIISHRSNGYELNLPDDAIQIIE